MCDVNIIPISGIREPFSSFSHVAGACVFAVLAYFLIQRNRGDRLRMLSLALMAYVSVQTLLISSVYHSLWPGPYREMMLRADVAGIFFLIAGSMTPVHVILFEGSERWAPLVLAWSTALCGSILRLTFFDQLPSVAGIAIFLAFGWGGAITAVVLWRRYGWKLIRCAVFGGLAYTVGATILVMHRPMLVDGFIGPHELWHLSVLVGLALHWRFIFQISTNPGQEAAEPLPLLFPLKDALPQVVYSESNEYRDAI